MKVWNELSGKHISLLEKEGWMRGRKNREATLVAQTGAKRERDSAKHK
jgi:hypothetical protein